MIFQRWLRENIKGRFLLLSVVASILSAGFYLFCEDTCVSSPPNSISGLENQKGSLDLLDIACKFPYLDPFNPVAMKYYQEFPTTTCPDGLPTITFYDGDNVLVNRTLRDKIFGNSTLACWYRRLSFHVSYNFQTGKWIGPFSDSISVTDRPSFVEVNCFNDQQEIVSRMHHYITRGEKRRYERPIQHAFKEDLLNVMLIGVDSLSSHLLKRAMPRSRDFLLTTMGSVEMNVYNKVGDNTFPNLLAIASGKYEKDIPGWSQTQGFDQVPFIWKEFKAAGYKTQYISDRPDFNVFSKPPTDCYNNPMVTALMWNKIAFNNNCFEDQIEINLWLNLIKEFAVESLHRSGRFFSLAMFKRPTHDFPNQASAVDHHYAHFLKHIFDELILNNTMLFFFGDHGPRLGNYRRTFEGSIEERSANLIIYVPAWFKLKHKRFYQNLLVNANRLTTNFDIHETLKRLLEVDYFNETRWNITSKSQKQRGQSLFSTISPGRTCIDADISPHFCMCNGGVPLATDHPLSIIIGQEVVKEINSLISGNTDMCATLDLQQVTSLFLLTGNLGGSGVYRIMITTEPGEAAFEATVEYSVTLFLLTTVRTLGLISRISAYRGLSDCVQNDKMLQMYCYCKNLL